MKNPFLLALAISLSLLLNSPRLWAGGPEGSGGSDYFRPSRAWFLSQDPEKRIKACYTLSPHFGVSDQELVQMVHEAFRQWANYIEAKRLLVHLMPNSLRIVSHLDLSSKCDGSEDLEFYFGTNDMKVVRAKLQYERPFGFAELNSDETPQPNWSPGFVWIADSESVFPESQVPSWIVSKDALRALILHEVGHIFGNGHVDNTVMTVHLAQFLAMDTDPATPLKHLSYYSTIDSVLELIPCLECSAVYHGLSQFDGEQVPPEEDDLSNSFRILTGREPLSPLSATFEKQDAEHIQIVFSEGKERTVFPIKVESLASYKPDSTPLFNGLGGKYFVSSGTSYYGEIQPLTGSKFPVAINYNMDRWKLSIVPLGVDMFPKPLFVAAP